MSKRKYDDEDDDRVYCYWCDKRITKFNSPEAEKMFSETGLCEQCQKHLKKGIEKCNL